jgi:hypothetical protein
MQPSNGESRFSQIAVLNMVCWLEVAAHFDHHIPGTHEVVWRVDMPSESATNFKCAWNAIAKDENSQDLSFAVPLVHDYKPKWSQQPIESV